MNVSISTVVYFCLGNITGNVFAILFIDWWKARRVRRYVQQQLSQIGEPRTR